jgi:molybdenum-dependent DNA-binding transcriptional regulator ModE
MRVRTEILGLQFMDCAAPEGLYVSAEKSTPVVRFPTGSFATFRARTAKSYLSDRSKALKSAPRGAKLHHMIDWDDVRYFLAVARGGSVRAAAERLSVNHSTVLRHIAQMEERLGARMFEKLPSGYRLTGAGEEVLEFAGQMEAASNRLETRIFGRDQSARGLLRVTLVSPFATHLLMPDFAEFARLHPEVELEILPSDEPVSLMNREADVAIRVVYNRSDLPLDVHGQKGPEVALASTLPFSPNPVPCQWV